MTYEQPGLIEAVQTIAWLRSEGIEIEFVEGACRSVLDRRQPKWPWEPVKYAIVLDGEARDNLTAMVCTLFHEYGHLLQWWDGTLTKKRVKAAGTIIHTSVGDVLMNAEPDVVRYEEDAWLRGFDQMQERGITVTDWMLAYAGSCLATYRNSVRRSLADKLTMQEDPGIVEQLKRLEREGENGLRRLRTVWPRLWRGMRPRG